MLDFTEKVVLITGAAGGICSATSNLFLKRGAKVINCDTAYSKRKIDKLAMQNENPVNIYLDIRNKDEVVELFDLVYNALDRIDVVVNGAGILRAKPFIDVTEEEWDNMMNINLRGAFFVSQEESS